MNSLQPMDLSPIGTFMEIPSDARKLIYNCDIPEQCTPELITHLTQNMCKSRLLG